MNKSHLNFRIVSRVITIGFILWGIANLAEIFYRRHGGVVMHYQPKEWIYIYGKSLTFILFGVFIEALCQKKRSISRNIAIALIPLGTFIVVMDSWWLYQSSTMTHFDSEPLFAVNVILFRIGELILPLTIVFTAIRRLCKLSLIAPANRLLFLFAGVSTSLTTLFIFLGNLIVTFHVKASFLSRSIQPDVFDYVFCILIPITCFSLIFYTLRSNAYFHPEEQSDFVFGNDELIDTTLKDDNDQVESAATTMFTVDKWIGYQLLLILPIVNLFVLINWCNKAESIHLRMWSVAKFRYEAFILLFYLFLILSPGFSLSDNLLIVVLVLTGALMYIVHFWLNDKVKNAAPKDGISIDAWFGKIIATIVPIYGLLQLVSWAMDKENTMLRTWARATLWMIPIVSLVYFRFYFFYEIVLSRYF